MATKLRCGLVALAVVGVMTAGVRAGDLTASLKTGKPELKSAGPLAFGPQGILFVGDTQGAAVFAFDTGDRASHSAGATKGIKAVNKKIAAQLGIAPNEVRIHDLAVNPTSGRAYLSVSRGSGPDAIPVIMRVTEGGKLEEFAWRKARFSKVALPNAPAPGATGRRGRSLRTQSITDLAYVDQRVFVAGLSNEEFASNLRSIPFPFKEASAGTGVEIFHGAHGRFETRSPVRTFAPFTIAGEPHLLAAYTCTPLVKFPIAQLRPGSQVRGTTVAELGNRNRPLDMVVYEKSGKKFLLMANSSRGVMKISTEDLERKEGITERVGGGGIAGQPYETIASLKGVQQLDRLNDGHALVLAQSDTGSLDLETIALP